MSLFRSLLSFLPCFPAPDLRRQSSFFDHPDPNGVDLRPPPYHFSAQFRQPLILRRMPHGPAEQYIIRIQVTDCHGSLRHPIMYRLDVAPEYAIRTGMDVVVEELEGGRGHAHLEWGYIAGVRAFEDQYVEFILMLGNTGRSHNLLVPDHWAALTYDEQQLRRAVPQYPQLRRHLPADGVFTVSRPSLTRSPAAGDLSASVRHAVEVLLDAGAVGRRHLDGSYSLHSGVVSAFAFKMAVVEDADVVLGGAHGLGGAQQEGADGPDSAEEADQ